MLEVKWVENEAGLADAYLVRKIVFQDEQGVPAELDIDGSDQQATSLVAYWDNRPVGTARFRLVGNDVAKIERVASLYEMRGKGVGRAMMLEIEHRLVGENVREIVMDAQVSAEEFYRHLGYSSEGEVFKEVGIEHIKMVKTLG